MNYFPIALRLKGRRVIVVGAGKVAERKIRAFLSADAKICVIAPSVTQGILSLYARRLIRWIPRFVQRWDICKASLIIAATDSFEVNKGISQWARSRGIPVNAVDRPKLSDFISPAILHFKKALIAVYTDGKDPGLSKDLKNYLKDNWNDFLSYRNQS